ncbi:MAG: hypothetical protein ABIQ02_11030 [Saprospiraceae bacterium]
MQKQVQSIVKLLTVLFTFSFICSCEKEHLEPTPPPGSTEPLVYIRANLNHDSIYLAGGKDSYVGSVSVSDLLTNRAFNFTLKNTHHPLHSYFQISINNYQSIQGALPDDLNNTIFPGIRHYQDTGHFIPLAATVVWIDPAGIRFSSDASAQTQSFIINSVEEVIFENNHFKKALLEFDCTLSDDHGHVIHLTHGKANVLYGIQ